MTVNVEESTVVSGISKMYFGFVVSSTVYDKVEVRPCLISTSSNKATLVVKFVFTVLAPEVTKLYVTPSIASEIKGVNLGRVNEAVVTLPTCNLIVADGAIAERGV